MTEIIPFSVFVGNHLDEKYDDYGLPMRDTRPIHHKILGKEYLGCEEITKKDMA